MSEPVIDHPAWYTTEASGRDDVLAGFYITLSGTDRDKGIGDTVTDSILIDVWGGDGKMYLGRGRLVGKVAVYAFAAKDGHLLSTKDCEVRPSENDIAEMAKDGAELIEIPGNPKIVLDDGRIVYGCQVWWFPVEGEATP